MRFLAFLPVPIEGKLTVDASFSQINTVEPKQVATPMENMIKQGLLQKVHFPLHFFSCHSILIIHTSLGSQPIFTCKIVHTGYGYYTLADIAAEFENAKMTMTYTPVRFHLSSFLSLVTRTN